MSWSDFKNITFDVGVGISVAAVMGVVLSIPLSWVVKTSWSILFPASDPTQVWVEREKRQAAEAKINDEARKRFEESCKSTGSYMQVGVFENDPTDWSCRKPQ